MHIHVHACTYLSEIVVRSDLFTGMELVTCKHEVHMGASTLEEGLNQQKGYVHV